MFKTLHDILKTDFQITDTDLEDAWKLKQEKGGELGEILVQRKVLSEQQLLEALSRLFDIPLWNRLPIEKIEKDFTQHVPIQFLKKHLMVPLARKPPVRSLMNRRQTDARPKDAYVIALHNPALFQQLDDLVRVLDR